MTVERLGEPGVDHADRPALGLERIGRLERPRHDRAEADEQQIASLAQDLALPDGQRTRLNGCEIEPRVARIVQREGVLLVECRAQQRAELLLVLRRGDDEVRQLELGGQGEHPLVARAVLADQPRAVDRDEHRLVVLADIVDGLIERALEERGVQRNDGPHPPSARPVAKVIECCSAIPTSKKRSGNSAWNFDRPVPVGMPAVIPTIRRSVRASSISSATKTAV